MKIETMLSEATARPWQEGWNTRYFDNESLNGRASMCGRGPDTMVLRRDDARFKELVADKALADAALIAALANSAAELLALVKAARLKHTPPCAIRCVICEALAALEKHDAWKPETERELYKPRTTKK